MINVKNFGLQYHSDRAIAQTSLFAMPASVIMRPYIGLLIDKFGVLIIYRNLAGVTVVSVILFYLFMDNIWVFYVCVMLFFALYACMMTIIAISTSFIYDHEVGKRLQKYIYFAFSAAGWMTVLIHHNTVLDIFG
jgi:MFS family permease